MSTTMVVNLVLVYVVILLYPYPVPLYAGAVVVYGISEVRTVETYDTSTVWSTLVMVVLDTLAQGMTVETHG